MTARSRPRRLCKGPSAALLPAGDLAVGAYLRTLGATILIMSIDWRRGHIKSPAPPMPISDAASATSYHLRLGIPLIRYRIQSRRGGSFAGRRDHRNRLVWCSALWAALRRNLASQI